MTGVLLGEHAGREFAERARHVERRRRNPDLGVRGHVVEAEVELERAVVSDGAASRWPDASWTAQTFSPA